MGILILQDTFTSVLAWLRCALFGLILVLSLRFTPFASLSAQGMASLAAGLAIGIVGDSSVRAYGKQDKIFVAMILMLIFAEAHRHSLFFAIGLRCFPLLFHLTFFFLCLTYSQALGLYGLIISLLMNNVASKGAGCPETPKAGK